ncbi:MAG TPA: NAD(P)-dependent oxidoreductase [bacterium]|nr:NAD(P)-dependent oxidoreductase [bacterium]
MSQRLGYIGMGIMGNPMARNLLKAGFSVSVYNRTREKTKDIEAEGASVCSSPQELAKRVDVIFTNVTDTPDVRAVLLGKDGVIEGCREGQVVIDNSTVSPRETREIAGILAERGVAFLDAPVSGGDIGAQKGTLTIMVGGDKAVYESCMPYFRAMGSTITWCGESGMGQMTKLCNQILCAVNMVATCECISLAKQAGLDVQTMLEVVSKGAGGSWALANLGPKIAQGDLRPGFMVQLIQKDLRLVMEAARTASLPPP